MSESLTLLTETAERLFSDLAARRGEPFEALWPEIEAAGFPALMIAETDGGFGGDWRDAFAVARLAGAHAVALPITEAIVAGAFGACGGGLTVTAPGCEGGFEAGRFTGSLSGVPFGRHATALLAVCNGLVLRLPTNTAAQTIHALNPAGEPRDRFRFEAAEVEILAAGLDGVGPFELGALMRAGQIAGALDAALVQSIDYVNQRVQFGKPLAKFQAMQQALAQFAEEAAAVNCAGQAAAAAADRGQAELEIAAAKLRANMAAGVGGAIAHQAHGAIGFTEESGLHVLTRRLIAWRSEFGADRFWAERLGGAVAAIGADHLWAELTRRTDTP